MSILFTPYRGRECNLRSPMLNSLREWGERRSTRVFALKIAQKRLEFEGVYTVTSHRYSSDPAENNAPFVHRCFVGTLPLRKKRSGYYAFCCAMSCKKQVPAFFKALLYSDVQKASPKSGVLVLLCHIVTRPVGGVYSYRKKHLKRI